MKPQLNQKSYLASICYAVEEGIDYQATKIGKAIKNFERKLIKRVKNE